MAQPAKVINMDEHRSPGPQVKDGFVRIANELFDAILLKLNSYRHTKVALAIIRKTYGYRKKEDDITISQLAELTGIHRNHVGAALKALEQMRVINPVRAGRHGLMIGINKHFDQWQEEAIKERGKATKTVATSTNLVAESTKTVARNSNQNSCNEQPKQLQEATKTVDERNQNVAHNRQPQKTTPTDNSNSSPATQSPDADGGLVLAAQPAELLPAADEKKTNTRKPADETALEASRAVWAAYSGAYLQRYGTTPIRPARVNAQIKKLIETVGREDAPALAAWFVGHPAQWYVTKGHDIGLLLADITKLHTEWATGRVVTSTAARQSDRRGAMSSALQNLLAECEGGAQ